MEILNALIIRHVPKETIFDKKMMSNYKKRIKRKQRERERERERNE